MTVLLSLGVGLVIGSVLALARLPIAAPASLAGVLCVAGISLGYWLIGLIK